MSLAVCITIIPGPGMESKLPTCSCCDKKAAVLYVALRNGKPPRVALCLCGKMLTRLPGKRYKCNECQTEFVADMNDILDIPREH